MNTLSFFYLCADCGQPVQGSARDPEFGLCDDCASRVYGKPNWKQHELVTLSPSTINDTGAIHGRQV